MLSFVFLSPSKNVSSAMSSPPIQRSENPESTSFYRLFRGESFYRPDERGGRMDAFRKSRGRSPPEEEDSASARVLALLNDPNNPLNSFKAQEERGWATEEARRVKQAAKTSLNTFDFHLKSCDAHLKSTSPLRSPHTTQTSRGESPPKSHWTSWKEGERTAEHRTDERGGRRSNGHEEYVKGGAGLEADDSWDLTSQLLNRVKNLEHLMGQATKVIPETNRLYQRNERVKQGSNEALNPPSLGGAHLVHPYPARMGYSNPYPCYEKPRDGRERKAFPPQYSSHPPPWITRTSEPPSSLQNSYRPPLPHSSALDYREPTSHKLQQMEAASESRCPLASPGYHLPSNLEKDEDKWRRRLSQAQLRQAVASKLRKGIYPRALEEARGAGKGWAKAAVEEWKEIEKRMEREDD